MADEPGGRMLAENLDALAAVNPALAAAVRSARADPRITCAPSRSGAPVPAVRTPAGAAPLHSTYDPRQEARRAAASGKGEGFLAVLGLGGGYHVEAALAQPSTHRVLVIEKDAAAVRGFLSCVDLRGVLEDPRLVLATGLDAIRAFLPAAWKPALMGGLRVLPLRPWCEQERGFFDAAAVELQGAIEAVRGDYGVQSHFGKRWFSNMLANLPQVQIRAAPAPPRAVVVAAAGPSLEGHAAELAVRPPGTLLLATDTSLPALVRLGVEPDAVVSIDCQVYGYHHFLQGLPARATLYLDLASPPQVARRFPGARFAAGGHPFARYLRARWLHLPRLDTSGGNVTHAAVSLARELGAGVVTVAGADFSYPGGKPYARGTWLYDLFQSTQGRMAPADSELVALAVRSGVLQVRDGRAVYTTAVMTGYRLRLEALMASPRAPALPEPAEPPRAGWREFLAGYESELRSLKVPGALPGMDALWDTVLPAAAAVVRDGAAPGADALERARAWSLERIHRILAS